MAKHPEQVSQGCVALLNLIISSVILFVLVLILMPGFVDLPEWAEDIRSSKLIKKRTVEGQVQVFPNPSNPSEDQLLIFNTRSGGVPIKKILNKSTPIKPNPILITSQKIQNYQRIWDKALPNSDISQYPYLKVRSDFNTLYLLYQENLYAWRLKDGQDLWQTKLETAINPACDACFQISLDFKVIVVLGEDQHLQVIDLKSGKLIWAKTLEKRLGTYPSFYLYKNSVGLTDASQGQNKYLLLDIMTGKTQKEIELPTKKDNTPLLSAQNQLFYFVNLPNSDAIQLRIQDIDKQTNPKNISLPSEMRLPSVSNDTYQYLKEWWLTDSRYVFMKVIVKNKGEQLIKINRDNARLQKVQHPAGYELVLLSENTRFLLVNARKLERDYDNQIWMIDKKEGTRKWAYTLKGKNLFRYTAGEITWSTHFQPNALVIIEKQGSDVLEATALNIGSGTLLKKKQVSINQQQWDGITWTEDAIWLSAQELYRIDLERYHFYVSREFP